MKIKIILALVFLFSVNSVFALSITQSKHNLSISGPAGPNAIMAVSEARICIFCHTPHNSLSSAPLWNRTAGPVQAYTPYSSSTLTATPGQPTGSSILCLSCHDGTIAIGGAVASGAISMTGVSATGTLPTTSSGNLGTDLSNDHPISFQYTTALANAATELVDPSTLTGAVRLDGNSELQCTSCHDAHDNVNGKFLVLSNRGSALCEACHQKSNWTNSPHNTSTSTWNGVAPDPWPNTTFTTVADNGCGNCHAAHNAGVPERLLNANTEEDTCFVCHNGNVTGNIQTDFQQISSHPLALATGVHQPMKLESAPAQLRHVECIDCHNAHAATTSPIGIAGINGLDWNGIEVSPITSMEQLCFKCHADSPTRSAAIVTRIDEQVNVRLEFATTNVSFHPIQAPSVIPTTTYIAGLPGDLVTCASCHVSKPHGSPSMALLIADIPALCYSCHDQNIVAGKPAEVHSGDHAGFSCLWCHDPHGSTSYTRLINFDTSQVTAFTSFVGTGAATGTCSLVCHGENHNNNPY